jgi:uncharacterized membrane protein YcaP (DUF421 family)
VLRIFGKREVGQFTLYDLVFVLLVANALQPAITGPDTSLVGGLVLIVVLTLTNYVIARIDSTKRFHWLFSPQPAVIIKNGAYVGAVMQREGVRQDECEMAMREHGVKDVKEVELGVLEPDGSISIVPLGVTTKTKRRVLFRHRSG